MTRIAHTILPVVALLALAGCASDRFAQRGYEPAAEEYDPPPPRRRTDAKTYLESGRMYDRLDRR
ncbi:MAG: hypothetical protein KF904_03035 [Rhodoblastus sp.]|nr:hypothetical protein [Rhodoblastus sp.]HPG02159.1 hypothetical protein [Rhodoblastus sp.]